MEPIVFLDIDGVLNNEAFYKDRYLNKKAGQCPPFPPMTDEDFWKDYCEHRGVPVETFYTKHKGWYGPEYYPFYHEIQEFDPKCVDILNKFTDKAGAKIVVSSSWRASGLDWMRTIFKLVDIKAEVIGVTPRIYKESDDDKDERGCEIEAWLNEHNPDAPYVIFDDDNDMTEFQIEHTFIKVDFMVGLTEKDTAKAEELLAKQIKGEHDTHKG